MTAPAALRLAPSDNVAVAVRPLAPGERIEVGGMAVMVAEPIPLGHKVALSALTAGSPAIKFGMPIGAATRAIGAGAWVHVHNLRSLYLTNDVDHAEDGP